MPMKTSRRHKDQCLFCGDPAHKRFHIKLPNGKRHIPIHTCGAEHHEYYRRVMRDFEVKRGGGDHGG